MGGIFGGSSKKASPIIQAVTPPEPSVADAAKKKADQEAADASKIGVSRTATQFGGSMLGSNQASLVRKTLLGQ